MITAKQLADVIRRSKHSCYLQGPSLSRMHVMGTVDLEAVAAELNKVADDKKVDRQ